MNGEHSHDILLSHAAWAFYGWIALQIILIMASKKTYDINKDGWLSGSELKAYFKAEFWPFLLSIWLLPIGIINAQGIWVWLMDLAGRDWPYENNEEAVHAVMGGLGRILQWAVKKLSP